MHWPLAIFLEMVCEFFGEARSDVAGTPKGGFHACNEILARAVLPNVGACSEFEHADRKLIFGANWDAERVYVWDFKGRLQRTLTDFELKARGLGVITGAGGRAGLAVQDWKVVGERFYASGLFRAPPGSPKVATENRLIWFTDFLTPGFLSRTVTLPRSKGIMLAREGMAISDGMIHFLPEDLGASNRLFRIPLADLTQRGAARP